MQNVCNDLLVAQFITVIAKSSNKSAKFKRSKFSLERMQSTFGIDSTKMEFSAEYNGKIVCLLSSTEIFGELYEEMYLKEEVLPNKNIISKSVSNNVLATAAQLCHACYQQEPEKFLSNMAQFEVLDEIVYDSNELHENDERYLCAISNEGKTAYVAFRGSFTTQNHLRNANILDTGLQSKFDLLGCHAGFLSSIRSIPAALMLVEKLLKEGYEVILCGHSAGGAMAAILNLHVRSRILEKNQQHINLKLKSIGFGAPYCFTETTERFIRTHGMTDKFITIVNHNDLVPAVMITSTICSEELSKFFSKILPSVLLPEEMITSGTALAKKLLDSFRYALKKQMDRYFPVGQYYFLKDQYGTSISELITHCRDIQKFLEDSNRLSVEGLGRHLMTSYMRTLTGFLCKSNSEHKNLLKKHQQKFAINIKQILGQMIKSGDNMVLKLKFKGENVFLIQFPLTVYKSFGKKELTKVKNFEMIELGSVTASHCLENAELIVDDLAGIRIGVTIQGNEQKLSVDKWEKIEFPAHSRFS
jgi:hypothetical protein